MNITLTNVGKRFNRDRIFSGLSHTFQSGEHTVILGSNGSGKSTLLQIIAGNTSPSEGDLAYTLKGKPIPPESLFRTLSFASPYMELLEELTLKEHIAFHAGLKPLLPGIDPAMVQELSGLSHSRDKQVRHFSSGMKQRLKLTLAILSDTPLLLLDEPCSNLDQKAVHWYQNLVSNHSLGRLILVCSNQQEYEYPFCTGKLRMEDYKMS
jgi:ABC-type multidrug transport system ATPase subunit